MNLNKKIEKILSENDFHVNGKLEKGFHIGGKLYYLEFGKRTPCGEDWTEIIWFDGSLESFANSLYEFAYNYDIDEAVEIWIPCRGKGGCPSSISDLLDDAKWKKRELEKLSYFFLNATEEDYSDEENSLSENYYNKDKMKETLDRLKIFADKSDEKILEQIAECLDEPLKLYALQEAEFQTNQVIDDILEYEESDMRNSILRLADKLHTECALFNNGEESYEIAEKFWKKEIKYYAKE